jgi:hypothetical protein
VGRRCFDHLVGELSVALGLRVPRYALWLELHERGWDPERLGRTDAVAFCHGPLRDFLARRGWHLEPRRERQLLREVRRFDPRHPTPYEHMERLGRALPRRFSR